MEKDYTIEEYLKLGDEIISVKQGYQAMLKLLYHYYKLTDSIDLTDILSGGALLEDGFPLDKAFWGYWVDAVEKVKNEK